VFHRGDDSRRSALLKRSLAALQAVVLLASVLVPGLIAGPASAATSATTITVAKVCVPSTDTGTFDLRLDTVTKLAAARCGSSFKVPVTPGTHTVGETAGTNTDLATYTSTFSTSCPGGSISLTAGQNKTCTITNTRKPTTITVSKVCVPSGDTGRFNLQIDTVTVLAGARCGSSRTVSVSPGPHTVGETAYPGTSLAGYVATYSGDCTADTHIVTAVSGQNVTCTITNTRQTGTLTVRKVCVPVDDPGKFNLRIDGVVRTTDATCGQSTGAITVPAGTHTFGETAGTGTSLANYVATYDCSTPTAPTIGGSLTSGSVSIAPQADVTCTITNKRKPTLTVYKECVGGLVGKWDLLVGTVQNPDLTNARDVGHLYCPDAGPVGPLALLGDTTYYLGEDADYPTDPTGYTATYDCNLQGAPTVGGILLPSNAVHLAWGDVRTCTVTNTKTVQTATLTVTKVCDPYADNPDTFQLTLAAGVSEPVNIGDGPVGCGTDASGTSVLVVDLAPGEYTVGETATGKTNLDSYAATYSGICDGSATFTLAADDNVTCTITNTKLARITVTKICDPWDGNTDTFQLRLDRPNQSSINLGEPVGCAEVGEWRTAYVPPATDYYVSETGGGNYTSSFSGDCSEADGAISLAAGDDKTCTITNTASGG